MTFALRMSPPPEKWKPPARRNAFFILVLRGMVRLAKLFSVWVAVAVVVGIIVVLKHPPQNPGAGVQWLALPGLPARITFGCGLIWRTASGNIGVGIGLAWWNVPGTVIGLIAGIYLSGKSWSGLGDDSAK